MLTVCFRLLLVLSSLLPYVAVAQLTITQPVPRMVFQRNAYNEASLLVTGQTSATATMVEARLVPLAIGQGSVTAWTPLDFLPNSSTFQGFVTATAGWYRLDVRTRTGNTLVSQAQVNRVGVGEVFVVAGQSNMVGGFEREPGAEEDRVSCIDFRQDALNEQLLPLVFSHVSYGTSTGPSQPPHIWGRLGDRLVRRLNVPVLFIGAAQSGTSSDQWRNSANGGSDANGQPFPYRRMGVALLHYVRRTGARAVLWHQGEGDISSQEAQYFNNIQSVIQKSRQQIGFDALPWVMSRVSYTQGQTNANVIAAQNRLIAQVPNVFAGPSTDDLTGPDNRLSDNVHFGGNGLVRFVDRWDQALNADFFAQSIPFATPDEASAITSGYTLPLTRRAGETVLAPSLRSNGQEASNQYFVQLLRASDNALMVESARGTANPLSITLPGNLADGQYRLRTLSTNPATTGTLSESFKVDYFAAPTSPGPATVPPVRGGVADSGLQRLGYRYENDSHGFWAMVQATGPVETKMERIDGGSFGDTDWHATQPSNTAPDYVDFADYNYLRNYPPPAAGVGGVEPGRYRLSVRPQGSTGPGFWYEATLQPGRNTLFLAMESVPALPPVITITSLTPDIPCVGSPFSVAFTVSESPVNADNVYSVQLSDANGSFDSPTAIGSGTSSPVSATIPGTVPADSKKYRLRVVASSPAVQSAPGASLTFCATSTGSADVSMALRLSNRTSTINQPLSCSITLTNAGPATANATTATCLLPDGITFIDSPSPQITASANSLTISAGSLPPNTSSSFSFRLKATRSGTFAVASQITACTTPDPDSTPNSGTGDGQDDTASADLRTTDASGALTASPNPSQTPLPGLVANQPGPDPSRADLSLALAVSNRIPKRNDVVTITVKVNNRGGRVVSSATVRTVLPDGWQLTNSTGLTVSGQTVTGTVASIAINSTSSLTLSVRVSGTGTVQSQLQTTTETDPDSNPGNGYVNGEDDTVSVSIRTR